MSKIGGTFFSFSFSCLVEVSKYDRSRRINKNDIVILCLPILILHREKPNMIYSTKYLFCTHYLYFHYITNKSAKIGLESYLQQDYIRCNLGWLEQCVTKTRLKSINKKGSFSTSISVQDPDGPESSTETSIKTTG